jgi:hypothetical protein
MASTCLEGGERIGTGADGAAGGVDEAGGEAPGMEGTTEGFGGGFDLGLGTDLFGGAQKKAGVTGPRVADELGLSWVRLVTGQLKVEVLALPAEAGFAGGVGEDPAPGVVEDLPLLGGVVEFDLGGADDFEGADLFRRSMRSV